MASQTPPQHPRWSTQEVQTRVHKQKSTVFRGIKRRNGLLNMAIAPRSDLMQIAQQNSLQSPLLRLPGELRDAIWKLALGNHKIHIQDPTTEDPIDSIYDTRTLYPTALHSSPAVFIHSTFQLPRVCRQIYAEAAPYVYTLNTFSFHSVRTLDRWIRNRCIGQKRMVASVDVPRTYARLYRSGFRARFRDKFPNILRVGIDNWTLFCEYDELRRGAGDKGRRAVELWGEARRRVVEEIKGREGKDVCVEWHGQSA